LQEHKIDITSHLYKYDFLNITIPGEFSEGADPDAGEKEDDGEENGLAADLFVKVMKRVKRIF
jgi:hypothetical protein